MWSYDIDKHFKLKYLGLQHKLVRDDYIQACDKGSPRRAKTFAISGLGMTLVKSYKRQMKRLIATPDYDPILEGV